MTYTARYVISQSFNYDKHASYDIKYRITMRVNEIVSSIPNTKIECQMSKMGISYADLDPNPIMSMIFSYL